MRCCSLPACVHRSRVRRRRFATQAVVAASTGASNATVRALQAEMREAALTLLGQHEMLLTGAPYPGLYGSVVGAENPDRKFLMFVEQCLLFKEEDCLPGDHPFWTRVHHGVNALVRYYVQARAQASKREREQLLPCALGRTRE